MGNSESINSEDSEQSLNNNQIQNQEQEKNSSPSIFQTSSNQNDNNDDNDEWNEEDKKFSQSLKDLKGNNDILIVALKFKDSPSESKEILQSQKEEYKNVSDLLNVNDSNNNNNDNKRKNTSVVVDTANTIKKLKSLEPIHKENKDKDKKPIPQMGTNITRSSPILRRRTEYAKTRLRKRKKDLKYAN